MYLTQLSFGPRIGRQSRDTLAAVAEDYLGSLCRNGQTYGRSCSAWVEGNFVAYLYAARPDALELRFHSEWSARALDAATTSFGQPPTWQILDDRKPVRNRPWQRSSSLYLFTHAFDSTSPICCGDTGEPIPMYLLPIDQLLRERLYFWSRDYSDIDSLCLSCGGLEIPAYKQMADPESEHAQSGRDYCAQIEQATGKPTYFFLHRYWGRREGESDRPCPQCGNPWSVDRASSSSDDFHEFPFRCEPCRLVSEVASTVEDERHARIGEYRPPRPSL